MALSSSSYLPQRAQPIAESPVDTNPVQTGCPPRLENDQHKWIDCHNFGVGRMVSYRLGQVRERKQVLER